MRLFNLLSPPAKMLTVFTGLAVRFCSNREFSSTALCKRGELMFSQGFTTPESVASMQFWSGCKLIVERVLVYMRQVCFNRSNLFEACPRAIVGFFYPIPPPATCLKRSGAFSYRTLARKNQL